MMAPTHPPTPPSPSFSSNSPHILVLPVLPVLLVLLGRFHICIDHSLLLFDAVLFSIVLFDCFCRLSRENGIRWMLRGPIWRSGILFSIVAVIIFLALNVCGASSVFQSGCPHRCHISHLSFIHSRMCLFMFPCLIDSCLAHAEALTDSEISTNRSS